MQHQHNFFQRITVANLILASVLVFVVVLLVACKKKTDTPTNSIYTVHATNQDTVLYFGGILQPIDVVNVSSPVDGVVGKINFHYGETVEKNDVLLTVVSQKLEDDYQDALTNYLKAKDNYSNKKFQMVGTEELHKAKVISEQEYQQSKGDLADTYLNYTQSQRKLKAVLANAQGFADANKDFSELDIEDLDEVQKALNIELKELTIRAPTFGVVLLPDKNSGSDNGSSSGTKALVSGSDVKQNQTLISIGDLSGLLVNINISEVDINQIKVGQPVTISSFAFPDNLLQGKISNVGVQAIGDVSGGLPTFPVEIVIPKLTAQDKKVIHVGMSAKIQLKITHPMVITVPIKAVTNSDGISYVKLVNKDGKTTDAPVKVGEPGESNVVVTKGLQEGDQIIVPN